ncbi:MAG: ATP-binding cassette domain-containing protein [Acidimicrobiales bacterium]
MAETIQVRVAGRDHEVGNGAIIGRGSAADLPVLADVVSRKHAQLHVDANGWSITDLGSANGLYGPDGSQIDSLDLPPGVTSFTLGPPSAGCVIKATVEAPLAEAETVLAQAVPTPDATTQPQDYRPAIQGDAAPPPAGIAGLAGLASPGAAPPPPAPERVGSGVSRGVALRADGLSVVVDGDLTILRDASLSVPAGSMVAIIGPSGCGKSTLANLLSGRSEPSAGSVTIDGEPMTAMIRRRIGVVPQYDAVHERLSVRQALRAAATLRLPAGTDRRSIDESVATTADTLGLTERIDTRVAKLSGGQKKRVSVGYELVSSPVMMVLDEPTSGLDPGLELGLIDELRALADRGTTTVLVTHSTEAAERSDLVVVMAPGGHVAFVGSPNEVLAHFGATEWSDVFAKLTADTGARWAAYFSGTEAYRRYVETPPQPSGAFGPGADPDTDSRSWFGDFTVMTSRYIRSIVADPKSLLLLLAQAPVLGVLFAFVLSRNVFGSSLRPSTAARELVLACVLAMVWIGASNSIREIVKERRTFLRERAVGVSPSSLVASRWAVLSAITVLQAVVLYLAATSRQRSPVGPGVLLPSGNVELIMALATVGLASVGIGLALSGFVQDTNKAMAVLPIVLIPIVLFSGLLIPTADKVVLEQVSWLNPVQWGSSAAAVTTDVLEREGCNPTGFEAQLQLALLGRTISCSNPRWQTTPATQAINFGVAAVQLGMLVVVSFAATARSTREIRL